jgi:hypothetical protein
MRKTLRVARLLPVAAIALAIPGLPGAARADGGERSLKADLDGFQEPPAVSSTGSGEFRARISRDRSSFEYTLRYEDLEGTVTQAHIHVGQKAVNGGISVWLCETSGTPGPAGTPTCPGPSSGEVTGTVTAAQVIGPSGQGIAAGEFEELLEAMREGVTYANVHSTRNLGGEIRGQIKSRGRDD